MAYFSQKMKKKVSPKIKSVLKKYGVKGTISVDNYSSLVVNIKKGRLDFLGADLKIQISDYKKMLLPEVNKSEYLQVNIYHVEKKHREVGETEIANFFKELIQAIKGANWYNRSDTSIDYFDTSYFIRINIGKWDKPYELIN